LKAAALVVDQRMVEIIEEPQRRLSKCLENSDSGEVASGIGGAVLEIASKM